jgi:hypothetical protein
MRKYAEVRIIGSMTICVGNSNLVIAMPNHLSAEDG